MAKKKSRSAGDDLLHECASRITPEKVRLYALFVFREPGAKKPTKAEERATLEALMDFATLGWAYYHGKRSKETT